MQTLELLNWLKKPMNFLKIKNLIKYPILKRVIPSLLIKIHKIFYIKPKIYKINNINFFLNFLDPIDRKIILTQNYEEAEMLFLIKNIKKKKFNFFLDVGANCGYYTLNIAKLFKINSLAFEPGKNAFFKLKKTLNANKSIKNVKLYNYGLSNKQGVFTTSSRVKNGYTQTGGLSLDRTYPNGRVEKCIFKVGDNVLKLKKEKISIKIDVEGHELKTLKGLKKILLNNNVMILIEILNENYLSVHGFLKSLGFKKIKSIRKNLNYFYSNNLKI